MLVLGTLATATAALGQSPSDLDPLGPVANGDFESLAVPNEVTGPLQGTAADECIGIGHQVRYGSQTPLGTATGGPYDDPNASQADPAQAADDAASDPVGQAVFASGYGHCEFSDEKGHDAYWLNPASAGGTTEDDAALWSEGSNAAVGFDFDSNPFDKEVRIASNPNNGGDHNLYQNLFHPGREPVYSANFDALEFDVEDGAIADDAFVQISLGAEPNNVQEPYAGVYIDCRINFSGTYLQNATSGGTVSASPISDRVGLVDWDTPDQYDGGDDGDPDCPSRYDWENATDDGRRDMLGRLSIVQVSFWNFNDGASPLVFDNIDLPGATTHDEEASEGNFRVCTDVLGPVDSATCNDDTVGKE